MNKSYYDHLVCPQCHLPLSPKDDHLTCGACNSSFPLLSDIPCFTTGESGWRFPLSNASSKLIRIAKEKGWRASLSQADTERADWIEGAGRFPISMLASPKGRVLDAGCGWGGLTFWLAKEFSHVYALDSQLDGLQFIDIRSAQDRVGNVFTVQGDLLSLPFPDRFFDLVLLNGVLEWVGTFSTKHPATTLQEMALREMARVLHPEGVLYVAIENRFGLQYFLGYREEHTGLRYISLFPRILAKVYHKYRRGEEFRALTHSRRGLTKTLRKSGFSNSKWFFVFPSYRNCKYAASLEGTAAIKFLLNNALFRRSTWPAVFLSTGSKVLSRIRFFTKLLSFFSPSWIIFASQGRKPQLALQSDEKLLKIENNPDLKPAISINERRANIFVIDEPSGWLREKYSIPVNEWATKKIEMSSRFITLIRKLCPSLNESVPEISTYSTSHGLVEYTKAAQGSPLDLKDPRHLDILVEFLMSFCEISIPLDEIQGIPQAFDMRASLSEIAETNGFAGRMQEVLKKSQIVHGDLSNGNILFSKAMPRQPIIIDFEHAKVGPAVLNWYDFLLRNFVLYGGRFPIDGMVVLKRCRNLPGNKNSDPFLSKLTAKFLNFCQIPLDLHGQLTVLYMSYLCRDPVVSEPDAVVSALKLMDLESTLPHS